MPGRNVRSCRTPVAAEKTAHGIRGQRGADEMALAQAAAPFRQESQLFLHLEAFRNHVDAEIFPESNGRIDEGTVLRIRRQAHDEAAVQLDVGQRQLPYGLQRCVAGTEVVQCYFYAIPGQERHVFPDRSRVLQQCVFPVSRW